MFSVSSRATKENYRRAIDNIRKGKIPKKRSVLGNFHDPRDETRPVTLSPRMGDDFAPGGVTHLRPQNKLNADEEIELEKRRKAALKSLKEARENTVSPSSSADPTKDDDAFTRR